jgi:hypothetical protein
MASGLCGDKLASLRERDRFDHSVSATAAESCLRVRKREPMRFEGYLLQALSLADVKVLSSHIPSRKPWGKFVRVDVNLIF